MISYPEEIFKITFSDSDIAGIGRIVTFCGCGAMQALPSSFLTVPNWQSQLNKGSVSVLMSLHLAKAGHLTWSQGLGHSVIFQVLQASFSSLY